MQIHDLDLQNEDPISLNDMETKLFAVLNFANGTLPENISKHLDKYIKIVYFESDRNWDKDLKDMEKEG